MATPVIMPRQGISVESCIITEWHVKKGDDVKSGDLLFTYETDKATFEEEAAIDGKILDIFFEDGDEAECLLNVCVIGSEGEDASQYAPEGAAPQQSPQEEVTAAAVPTVEAVIDTAQPVAADGNIKISPRARLLAEKEGIPAGIIPGTGPYGRIIERDVKKILAEGPIATRAAADAYAAAGTLIKGTGIGGRVSVSDIESASAQPAVSQPVIAEAEYTDVKLPNIRKVIAKAIHKSLTETAQLTLNSSFDATAILAFRKKVKASMEAMELNNITLNDVVLFAVSRTLKAHPDLNAHFLGDTMRLYSNVNLGVAVDTKRGLMVPTIFGADIMSLNDMAAAIKTLAANCQSGTINPDYLSGGTFTVTNLGVLGVESFTPVLNAPQTGILGVNNITYKAKPGKDGMDFYPAMGLSLTFDHRAVDGAPAARFLKDICANLENFEMLLTL